MKLNQYVCKMLGEYCQTKINLEEWCDVCGVRSIGSNTERVRERERDGSIRLFYTSEDNWGQPKIDRENIAQQIKESKRGK